MPCCLWRPPRIPSTASPRHCRQTEPYSSKVGRSSASPSWSAWPAMSAGKMTRKIFDIGHVSSGGFSSSFSCSTDLSA
eukprot:670668-Prymnesium_polylepis.1